MAIDAPTRPSRSLRGSTSPTARLRVVPAQQTGTRDDAARVSLVVPDALAPCIEGMAACDEAIAALERIVMAAMAGAPMAVVHQAQRATVRLIASRNELRRMVEDIEPHGAA